MSKIVIFIIRKKKLFFSSIEENLLEKYSCKVRSCDKIFRVVKDNRRRGEENV